MKDIKQKLEKAVEVRETGRLEKSAMLFSNLLSEVEKDDGDLYLLVMAEYIIQLRLEGKAKYEQAYRHGEKLWKEYPNEPMAMRSFVHPIVDLGGFEIAEDVLRRLVELYPSNSLKKGEAQAHLVNTLMRIGKLEEASKLIKLAINNIRRNTSSESYIEVRESYALMVRALLLRTRGEMAEAKQSAYEALKIAEKGRAVFRVKQAEEVLKLFK